MSPEKLGLKECVSIALGGKIGDGILCAHVLAPVQGRTANFLLGTWHSCRGDNSRASVFRTGCAQEKIIPIYCLSEKIHSVITPGIMKTLSFI
jgi:hypothetical protein